MDLLDRVENAHLEQIYLRETFALLVDYDGFNTVDGLKGLIDEARERIAKVLNHEVTRADVFGPSYAVFEVDEP